MSKGRSMPAQMKTNNIYIHPTAQVSDQAVIGTGTRIWNNCQIRERAQIGAECIIGKDVYIDFEVSIGARVKIQNGVLVYHGATIEEGVFIGPGVIFTNDRYPRAITPTGSLKTTEDWENGKVHIGYGASIGAGSVLVADLHIGEFALVGAGSVVTRDVPDRALVFGNPAVQVGVVCKSAHRMQESGPGRFECPKCGERYSPAGE